MAEQTTPFRNMNSSSEASETVDRVKSQLEDIVDSLDFPELGRRVQRLGRENPVALAFAALTIGVAAGMLMRKSVSEIQE